MRPSIKFLLVSAVLLGGAVPGAEAGALTATFTTSPNGGNFAPKNVVAVWVEGPGGVFEKTIGQWDAVRGSNLVAWVGKAGPNDADAVSGATRASHATPLTVTWNLLNKAGTAVPDGTYTLRMEMADSNTATAANNHEGTFTFVIGPTAQAQTALTNGGFTNVSINFDPGATPPPPPPPPSGGGSGGGTGGGTGGGGGDAGTGADDGAIQGGCAAGGGSGGLATFALLGACALVVRRRRR